MEDIELHDATHVKTIIDKGGGRCNATQSDVRRMASLSQNQVNSNYVSYPPYRTGSDVSFDFRACGKQTHVKRINSMLYVWNGLGSRGVPTQHYGLMELMYLTLIQLLRSDQIRS